MRPWRARKALPLGLTASAVAWWWQARHFDDDHVAALSRGAFCQTSTGQRPVLVTIIPEGRLIRRLGCGIARS
jgi:hypothetical protein